MHEKKQQGVTKDERIKQRVETFLDEGGEERVEEERRRGQKEKRRRYVGGGKICRD